MSLQSRNVRQAIGDTGLDGRGKLWSGEVKLGTIGIEVMLKALALHKVTKGFDKVI